ncbi:NAD(P)-dependent oxidoreductase [Siccirubricoccus deserti]|uniref:SDR family oxidoreductase n=1 Tax=Siccirubricoccus deserti TaxID=2013562 RepID=A0A9X0QYZ0_9PROT|nr:SDR family oxidoreductase [Siccirubricoccus deserti]MBC4015257.1 SDR family oxidoreductase [Siccirubricoccus deserti]GGC37729.1 NAD(P)-dependent oxidoreductase [Siccirubricoccus deserti]
MPDEKPTPQPKQHQDRHPGLETEMTPQPRDRMENWRASGKLDGKTAIITGGDSGIGRAVAIGFAKEGADVVVLYKDETEDAEETRRLVEATGRRCRLIPGDIGDVDFCRQAVEEAARFLGGRIDLLVNNAAEQHVCEDFAEIPEAQVERTFRTNILGMFWITRAALQHMPEGGAIINTTSITAYKGSPGLIDYASTKGAILAFTRSLSQALYEQRKIRVNAVAPGPIWTPLIPASFDAERTAKHGQSSEMGRVGQPDECAPSYIFLAAESDSSYINGQVLHPNGGTVVNG